MKFTAPELAPLTGTPKQIAYATALRARWIKAKLEVMALDLKIINGEAVEGVDLVEGTDPQDEGLRDAFVAVFHKRVEHLNETARWTSAAKWINSPEGRWAANELAAERSKRGNWLQSLIPPSLGPANG